jgi:uncharacterized membrane protein
MNELSKDGAPASVGENVEKIIRVENEALRPSSRSGAITDAIGGFIGTISFVILQIVIFAGWSIVNAGIFSQIPPFDAFPYSLLSSITSLEAVLIAAFVLTKPDERHRRPAGSSRSASQSVDGTAGDSDHSDA